MYLNTHEYFLMSIYMQCIWNDKNEVGDPGLMSQESIHLANVPLKYDKSITLTPLWRQLPFSLMQSHVYVFIAKTTRVGRSWSLPEI